MRHIFLVIASLFIVYLSSCRDLSLDDRPDRRREDPYGKVELPEEVMDEGFFDFTKCKPSVDTPDNTMDILTGFLPVKNPFRIARRCLKDKLEKARNSICEARYTLENQREQARDNATKNRIENQIYRLDQIQWRFNQKMQEMARSSDDYREKAVDKKDSTSSNKWWLTTLFWMEEQETAAYSNIFDIASFDECYAPVNNNSRRDTNRDRTDRDRNRTNGRRIR